MGLKKGMSNFTKKQQATVFENTEKIELALKNLPTNIDKISLSKIISCVSKETGLHITTIKKNEDYLRMCEEVFLNLMKVKSNGNPKELLETKNKIRMLELENTNLKNQITSLSNVIKRLEKNDNLIEDRKDNSKEALEAILEHFKEHLQIVDGNIVDVYSGVRPKIICKIN